MKKYLILFISVLAFLSFSSPVQAQKKRMMLFNQYSNGTILMKNGTKISVGLNYDTANKKMMYLQNDEEMILLNDNQVDTVYVSGKKFIWLDNIYLEAIELQEGSVFIDWSLKNVYQGNKGAYGQITQNKVETINTAHWTNDEYKIQTAEVIAQKNANKYWFFKNGKLIKWKDEKSLLKHFPDHKDEIKTFIKEKKIDFKTVNDVLILLDYCLGIS
ncbi:hypothetical protein SAMN05216365_12016 [Porphyromonadaceae bacterium NLAE-zl-C104]|nr:hypothetical protein SAMN05216331_12741 [Porphyromonadaceae bacterium KH3R12]SFS80667.1 hypothetical protein SAMN05216365_12016 [Porphyromonadaceae bacterium NLAE-zl-C104]